MESVHNPDRFMSDLRQILSQGRKRLGFLVGAGAPLAIRINDQRKNDPNGRPLIPGIDEITNEAIASLTEVESGVVEKIRTQLANNYNIETLLSKLRLLHQALGDQVVWSLSGDQYAKLSEKICGKIGELVGSTLPAERCAYNELVGWISGTQRQYPIEIFTTNYDLLFEESFEQVKAPYFDGFSGGSTPFFDPVTVSSDDLPPRWSRLWKLHGSLGWSVANNVVVRSGGRKSSQLVYPDHLKYDLTQKQPYTALFERLKDFLLTPDTLLLSVGFSFRDAHVCAVLDESLAINANAAVFAFQYKELAEESAACKLAYDHPNLSVYAADGAVISGVPGDWRPGELPKNWTEIRASFWDSGSADQPQRFLLGDFGKFARFCALSQAADIVRTPEPALANSNPSQQEAPTA